MDDQKKIAPKKDSSIQEKLSFIQSKFTVQKTGSGNRNAKYWKIEPLKAKFASIVEEFDLDVCCYIQNELGEIVGKPFIKCTAIIEDSNSNKISVEHVAFLDISNGGMSASMYTGSAGTYSNRYALCALFNVTDIDDRESNMDDKQSTVDPESLNYKDKPEVIAAFKEQNKASISQINYLKRLVPPEEYKDIDENNLSKTEASKLIEKYKK